MGQGDENQEQPSNELPQPGEGMSSPPVKGTPATADPLQRYIAEIQQHDMLSPQEEFRLASKLHETGDIDAAKRLVQANLRLVVKIAHEYRNFYSNMLDLIQEGNIGLMKAVSKFDPTRGTRLSYYATWWIRSYILKYLLDNFRLVKIGTTQAQKKLFYHLMREKDKLEAQGIFPGPKLLAQKLDVKENEVVEMEKRLSGQGAELSLDAPVNSDDDEATAHLDFLRDEATGADKQLAHQQLLHRLKNRLPEFKPKLNSKEQSILEERLLAEQPKTLQEIADTYNLTRERVRQIEAQIVKKLKKYLGPELDTEEPNSTPKKKTGKKNKKGKKQGAN